MDYQSIRKLQKKLYFSLEDISDILEIKRASARVLCNRYAKQGLLVRLKRDFYTTEQNWEQFQRGDFFKIANRLQVPSYISFLSALSFYEATTQIQNTFFESASLKRSIRFSVRTSDFVFYKLKKEYYFDFIKQGEVFIATREKALIDAIHLYAFGRYALDLSAIDLNAFDKKRIKSIISVFPSRTRGVVEKLCKI